ncbi:OsmC family protein [Streptomyces flavalbus]|uniref:OsmC family protein n=1 Tax=Streptomyces flavalbus TaxID=2665155 RepID=A0ABW2WEK4_9ACTN
MPQDIDLHRLDVVHVDGDAYAVDVRGHRVLVDQPRTVGGADTAPTPVELFAASLGACVAFYAGRFLHRHGLARDGLRVRTEFVMADRPARVESLRVVVVPPPGFPPERRDALLAVASHCTVHHTLKRPPGVDIELG